MKTYQSLVAGQSQGQRALAEVRAPWDGRVLGQVEVNSTADLETAMAAAHDIVQQRRWLPKQQRIAILAKVKEKVSEQAEALAAQAAAEGGKPLMDSKVEIARAIDGVQSCIDCLRTEHGEEIPMGITPSSANRLAMTTHEPIGLVLAYSAFNHPFNLIVHQVLPAVAAGCPVIVKPASDTPLSCYALMNILHESGLPLAYGQAVYIEDLDQAQSLVADSRIDFFSFIGSAKVGWMLRGLLAPGARCALEHGGVAPVIMAEDANVEECLPLLAKGGFYHAGQVCVSVQRIFVAQAIATQVAQGLAKLAEASRIGNPDLAETEVGPLIRAREVERVDTWVQEAIAQGAQCLCGGKPLPNQSYACTVLLDPPEDARVSQEEIFAPVICVYTYETLAQAVERANQLPFSFQAAVMTQDIDTAMYCFERLQAAAVFVNDHTAFRVDWMPFAGHKVSGHGTGGIRYTFEEMQARKLMVIRSKNL